MTDEIVHTHGRAMTAALQRALDGIEDREHVITAFREQARTSSTLGRLYGALATELRLVDLREQHLLQQLALQRQADLPEPPYPPATGQHIDWHPDDTA